jgi:hypothetical protein
VRHRARFLGLLGTATVATIAVLVLPATDATAQAKGGRDSALLTRALRTWARFPVASSPRPLVLLEGYVLAPENGFPDDDSKIAFGNGQIAAPASWPSTPKSVKGLPIIAASGAFNTLTASRSVLGSPPPLRTTRVQLGSGLFLTDRGWRILPAWLFSLAGVQNPAKVLAVGPAAIFSAPDTKGGNSPAQLSVTVARGGRRVVANIVGASPGTGPCTASYTLSIKESKAAVAVVVNAHPHTGASRHAPGLVYASCFLVGYLRDAGAELNAPLGARVVVDAESDGAASVTPTSSSGPAKGDQS